MQLQVTASEQSTRVLVADPIRDNRVALIDILSSSGISCIEAADGLSAWQRFTNEKPDLVLASLQLPGIPALDLLNRVRDVSSTPFVVQVPAGAFAAAMQAMHGGASDVIPLPFDSAELPKRIRAAIATNSDGRSRDGTVSSFAGRSSVATRIREQIRALAGLRIPVLFSGEKGSGRDHTALCLVRSDGFDPSNVLKLTPGGCKPRTQNDLARIVYIDEIELHSRVDQAYWCARILESERSAANSPRRVLASTTSDLAELVRRDEIDKGLAKTLLRFVVAIPPLRERSEDLPSLTSSLALQACRRIGRTNATFTAPALKLLQRETWPGNVSQLAAIVEKLVAFSPDGSITRRAVSSVIEEVPASISSLRRDALRRQREELTTILEATGGNLAEAARRLSMSRGAVIYRAQKFGLLAKRARSSGRVTSPRATPSAP
jgi:DNA-binding NtrC family response regulator